MGQDIFVVRLKTIQDFPPGYGKRWETYQDKSASVEGAIQNLIESVEHISDDAEFMEKLFADNKWIEVEVNVRKMVKTQTARMVSRD